MIKRKKQSSSLIFALLPFLLLGVLYLTPAYAGPETLGPSRVQDHHRLDTMGIPAQYFGASENDAEPVAVTTDEGAFPTIMGQVNSTEERAAPLRSASGFDAFNAGYGNQWKASFSEKTGKVKVLYGAQSKQYENGAESVARGFLGDSHAIFGLKQDLFDLKTKRVDRTPERDHVKFQQTYNNVPIAGVFVLVHSNPQGQVTMVQNSYIQGFQVANAQVVAEEAAKNIARNDLQASLKGATLSDAKAEQLITPYKGAYYYIWKVAIPTRNPFGYWVYHVDAATGEILYKGNEINSLKTGQGRAFTSNTNWYLGRISNVPLKNMFTSAQTVDWGYLFGAHAAIYDYNGNDPRSLTYKFLYDYFTQEPWFDATHAYYMMNTVWDWWNNNVVKKYTAFPHLVPYFSEPYVTGYYYPIPTLVNCVDPACQCNAFYSSTLFGAGYPGIAFGDENTCVPGSEDLVIDQDVVRHEYTHAMMDWMGFGAQFGGPLNYYGRAMGEGNSDWFAYLSHTRDPGIGGVAWYWSGTYLRYLDWTWMYPYDVGCNGGVPEEHCTGEIWGGYLYDLYRVLGPTALKYVFQSFFYFDPSIGWMDSGNPYVGSQSDFFDAIWAQLVAESDLTGRNTSGFKAWGSMTSRGINGLLRPFYCNNPYFGTGAYGCDTAWSFWWNFPAVKTINTKGNLLATGDPHDYIVNITQAGWDLTAMVTGTASGIISPSITLYTSGGAFVAPGVTVGNKATLKYMNVPTGLYVVRVTGTSTAPARGYYNFLVKVN